MILRTDFISTINGGVFCGAFINTILKFKNRYDTMTRNKKYLAPSVRKAIEIIDYLTQSDKECGISKLARELKVNKSSMFGIAQALCDYNILEQNPYNKKYYIGPQMFYFTLKNKKYSNIRRIVRSPMENLCNKINETVLLGVISNLFYIVISSIEAKHSIRISIPRWTQLPLYTAPGKIFLSLLPLEEVRTILEENPPPKYTRQSITDIDKYVEIIAEVKQKGYAIDDEDYFEGIRSVAIPVQTSRQPLILSTVGFSNTMRSEQFMSIVSEMNKTSNKIRYLLSKS